DLPPRKGPAPEGGSTTGSGRRDEQAAFALIVGCGPCRFASGKPLWRTKRDTSRTPRSIAGGAGRQGATARRSGSVIGALAMAGEVQTIALARFGDAQAAEHRLDDEQGDE